MNRLRELAERSYQKNIFCFTDFLTLEEASEVQGIVSEENYKIWNEDSFCERVMIRFGNVENTGYEQDFPIRLIRIKPLMKKFAEDLTHRDFLGALMNLGVERATIGDIRVEDKEAYVFVVERMSEYVVDNLTRVRHTNVMCEKLENCMEADIFKVQRKEERFTTSSERCDSIIAKTYRISRKQTINLFTEHKVFVDSKLYENNSGLLKEGNIVSVRGYGKFEYKGILYHTKKEKLCIAIDKYV